MKRNVNDVGCRFLNGVELWSTLDRLSAKLLGITASEFEAGWRNGRFRADPMAPYLAQLLPFVTRPRDLSSPRQ
jgi:hypothetical protein